MVKDINIGIIGGSGIYELDNMKVVEEIAVDTPFGSPSSKYIICDIQGIKIAFLSRHSKGHKIMPSELNSRANIYGFKKLGVKHLISVSAVGSLREEIKPSHLVFPDQIIDRTKGRVSTFFGNGIVAHVGFAEPFCHNLIKILSEGADKLKINYHKDKTYVCMEGPMFSTKAESKFHRLIGGDIIGMTAIPEAKLAREAEICYGMIALSTDYDCWREGEESVTLEMILDTIAKNISNAKKLLQEVLPKISYENCRCHNSLNNTFMTTKEHWPKDTNDKLDILIKKYL